MYRTLKDTVFDIIQSIYNTRGLDQSKDFLEKLFQFRSARKRQIRDFYEALHDAFTEYVTTGNIRTGELPVSVKGNSIFGMDPPALPEKDSFDYRYIHDSVDDMIDTFKTVLEEQLDSAKGKWYVV